MSESVSNGSDKGCSGRSRVVTVLAWIARFIEDGPTSLSLRLPPFPAAVLRLDAEVGSGEVLRVVTIIER